MGAHPYPHRPPGTVAFQLVEKDRVKGPERVVEDYLRPNDASTIQRSPYFWPPAPKP